MILIPISRTKEDSSLFDLQVSLDDVTYTLEFRWNVRCESWFFSIWNADQSLSYATGLKLVANWPLNLYNTDPTPPGWFFLLDSATDFSLAQDPGFDDLGTRHLLYYANLANLRAGVDDV